MTDLFLERKNGYAELSIEESIRMEEYCRGYMKFLDAGKTERLCVDEAIRLAKDAGYVEFAPGMKLEVGDKVYLNNRGKELILAYIGEESLARGVQIAAAHIDAPRLDLKPNPLYEDTDFAYLKTHYYGGIRKYQWVTIPLELHGKVCFPDKPPVDIHIGCDEGDPRFVITDLLPHLSADQDAKKLKEAHPGENLNLLIGSRPVDDGEKGSKVKQQILEILYEKYGMKEIDFISAELEAVPAGDACEIGLDRSMIGAYGHDDRSCAYAELRALLDISDTPRRTAICVLADKEEIGSDGVTGMQSDSFDTFMEDICIQQGVSLRACYSNSFCLSADVTAAYDPNYSGVFEKNNAAYLNRGVGLCKYTGSRGKSGASDAGAEVLGYMRKLLDKNEVIWQIAELGKVDEGGGGTVAKYMANRNIDTLDAGVPVLSMHSPFEVVSKLDVYETHKTALAVFKAASGVKY